MTATNLDWSSLAPEERTQLFIDAVKASNEVWGLLGAEGWIMLEDLEQLNLPVWPSAELASSWRHADLPDCQPTPIQLAEFLATWLPGLGHNNTAIAVCPVPGQRDVEILDASDMTNALTDAEDERD